MTFKFIKDILRVCLVVILLVGHINLPFTHAYTTSTRQTVTSNKTETSVLPRFFDNWVLPSLRSFIVQYSLTLATLKTHNDPFLGLNMYRGFQCTVLSLTAIAAISKHTEIISGTRPSHQSFKDIDPSAHKLNKSMLGYLVADLAVQALWANHRKDLYLHHIMAIIAWGYTVETRKLEQILNLNIAVELLSALKGLEHALYKGYIPNVTRGQARICLKYCSLYRLFVILLIRYPTWLIDWRMIINNSYQLSSRWLYIGALLNSGIVILESYWLFGTWKRYQRYRH